jgi:hypothetical protein
MSKSSSYFRRVRRRRHQLLIAHRGPPRVWSQRTLSASRWRGSSGGSHISGFLQQPNVVITRIVRLKQADGY